MNKTPYWKALSLAALLGFSMTTSTFALPAQADVTGKGHSTPAASVPKKAVNSGIDRSDLDLKVDPTVNFFDYATGGWRAKNPIPNDESRWGSFNVLADNNIQQLRSILREAAITPQDQLETMLGAFYTSGLDTKSIDAVGLTPIKEDLQRIAATTTKEELLNTIVSFHKQNIFPYFGYCSTQDEKNSQRMIGLLWQSGLGLPERDYYLRTDADSQQLLAKYREYVASTFCLLGDSPQAAKREADAVMAIETKLAKYSLPAAELRDPQKVYNLMSRSQLMSLAPGFDWDAYFKAMGTPNLTELNVGIPDFVAKSIKEINGGTSLEDHKSYLRFALMRSAAPYLCDEAEKQHFNFYSTALTGVSIMKPRWKRVVNTIGDSYADQALGMLYVRHRFSPNAKARVQDMVNNILAAMEEDIPTLNWMSDTTKTAAIAKLHSFTAKIGYPAVPRDYSKLKLTVGDYYGNVRKCNMLAVENDLAKIGKPVDPNEWYMPAYMVNAYYSPNRNEIVFPAGILQPPFFNFEADDAVNYGAIGMVIGHEISHGFDDQGSQYDGQGNLRNWWTKEDKANFQNLAQGVEEQFGSYEINGLKLNGKLVLGEALADLNGLNLAWMAYQRSQKGKEPQVIDGFTPAQRFFLGYAKVWAGSMRPERERQQVYTDPHPHSMWRVNGPCSCMPEFFEAFNVPEGSPMRRPANQRTKMW